MIATVAVLALFAQQLSPIAAVQVYTLADPVRPGGIGLATPAGRFAVSQADDCAAAGLAAGQNVMFWTVDGFANLGVVGVIDADGVVHQCDVRIEQQVDPTPCFVNAEGACDVALEQPED